MPILALIVHETSAAPSSSGDTPLRWKPTTRPGSIQSRRAFVRASLVLLVPLITAGCGRPPGPRGRNAAGSVLDPPPTPGPGVLSSAVVATPSPSAGHLASARAVGAASALEPARVAMASGAAPALSGASSTASPAPIPRPVVFLDPGHGGVDTGTIGTTLDGATVLEKTITLALAQQTATKLRAEGFPVVLSRVDDSLPGSISSDYTADGKELTPDGVLADLQRRIDRANASGARVLLSIHLNGFDDPSARGTETFYDSARPFRAGNLQFAALIQNALVTAFRAHGDDTPDRGVTDDVQLIADLLGSTPGYHHLVMLGPGISGTLQPSQMPGALSESLYLTNPSEASAAIDPTTQDFIAGAYASAIVAFLQAG